MSGLARPITGRRVLVWLLAFFGTVSAVNAAFVYFALHTFPGLSTRHPYEEGISYNRALEMAAAQRALGWRGALRLDPDAGGYAMTVRIQGPDGKPVTGLDVSAELRRPVVRGLDVNVKPLEVAPGVYRAAVRPEATGRWVATVHARDAAGNAFAMTDDVMVGTGRR